MVLTTPLLEQGGLVCGQEGEAEPNPTDRISLPGIEYNGTFGCDQLELWSKCGDSTRVLIRFCNGERLLRASISMCVEK